MAVIVGAWWGNNRPDQSKIRRVLNSLLAESTDIRKSEEESYTLAVGRRPSDSVTACESVWMCDGMIAAGRFRYQCQGTELKHSSDFFAHFKSKALISNGQWLAENVWGKYVVVAADEQNSRLCLFRDPTGLGTLYYWNHSEVFFFASEFSALRRHFLDSELDVEYLASFMVLGSHTTSRTPISGLFEVGPGEMVQRAEHSCETRLFWNPVIFAKRSTKLAGPRESELRDRFVETVSLSLDGDSGIYVDLSGGVDSSAILAAIASKKAAFEPIIASTVFHESVASASELQFAREVATSLGVKLLEVDGERYLPLDGSHVEIATYGKPTAQLLHSALHQAHRDLAQETRCSTFVNGYGGDQVFQARLDRPLHLADYLLSRSLGKFWREVKSTCEYLGMPYSEALRLTAKDIIFTFLGLHAGYLGELAAPRWCSPEIKQFLNPAIFFPPYWIELRYVPPLKVRQVLEIHDAAAHVDRGLRALGPCMHHPLLELPLVQTGLLTPTSALLSGSNDRVALRKAAMLLLPASVAARRSKGEYSGMYQLGLRKNLKRAEGLLLEGWLARNKLVRRDLLRSDLKLAAQGYSPHIWPLLNALAVELWIEGWYRRN